MYPKTYLNKFAAAVVKRSDICKATVEVLLPHVFDEIRYQLTEGSLCVPIDGFGTFHVKDIPEHEFYYNYKGADQIRTVPAKKQIKFAPTRNLTDEVNRGRYDDARTSFVRMPGDPMLRKRHDLRYKPAKNYDRSKGAYSRPIYKKKADV